MISNKAYDGRMGLINSDLSLEQYKNESTKFFFRKIKEVAKCSFQNFKKYLNTEV